MSPQTKYPIIKGPGVTARLALVLWGPAGVGKSTWCASAPGNKLWLSYGDNEHSVVKHRNDVSYIDLASLKAEEIFQEGIGNNPYNLDFILSEDKEIDTLVVDSLTVIQHAALEKAVLIDKVGTSKTFAPTMGSPGLGAYGGRNMYIAMLMKSLLRVTAKHQANIIFTAHEDDPSVDQKGNIQEIRMSLTRKIINSVSSSMSEIWNLRQEPAGKRNRIVTVRHHGYRRPLKTRMFLQNGESSFNLEYDPDLPNNHPKQMTIEKFYEAWCDSKTGRIPVPNNRAKIEDADNEPKVIKE